MALGTATIASITDVKGVKLIKISFAGDTSYPTGGTLLFTAYIEAAIAAAAAAAGDANVRGPMDLTIIDVLPGHCGQYVPSFDAAADSLLVQDGGHATWNEVTGTTALNGTTFNLVVIAN